jgi:tetratricopeptide (TPR) repeat protein
MRTSASRTAECRAVGTNDAVSNSPIAARTVPSPPRRLGAPHYIFAAVLLLRVIALARLSASGSIMPTGGDAQFYLEWARRISHGQLSDHLAFYGLPLYPFLLALLSRLLGSTPFVPGVLQAVCDSGTATLLFKIAARVFQGAEGAPFRTDVATSARLSRGEVIGILAAAGWAFFLPAEAYAISLMPTAIGVFAFWFIVWQVVKRDHLARRLIWFGEGIVVGSIATGVATVLFAAPLLIAAAIFKPANSRRAASAVKARIAAITFLLGGILIGTAPCWIHNRFVAEDPVFLSAHSGINFWIGNNPDANGYPRFPSGLRAQQRAMLEDSTALAEAAVGHRLKRSEVSEFWSGKARSYIRSDFRSWLRLMVQKASNFWNAFQYDDLSIIERLRREGVLLGGLRFGAVAALALPGAWFALRSNRSARWLGAAVLLQMAAVLLVFVTERYRLGVVPGLLIFAAGGLMYAWESLACRQLRPVIWYVGLLAISTTIVSSPRRELSLWALAPYNAGREALEAGDLRMAQQELERALAYVPDNPEANLAMGNLWLQRNDAHRAEQYYLTTVAVDPSHKAALSNLAVLALDQRDPARAITLLSAAMKSAPDDAKTHYLLAKAQHDAGNHAVALSEIETAIRLNPEQHEFLEFRDQLRAEPPVADE